jgi:hypothetical protein
LKIGLFKDVEECMLLLFAIHRAILVARLDLIDLYIKIVVSLSERSLIY